MYDHTPKGHQGGLPETDDRAEYLRELRLLLMSLGCSAEPLRLGSGAPGLRLTHPHHPSVSADVTCLQRDGQWWFTWAGGKIIGPPEDLGGVAVVIFTTLRDRPAPP